MSEKTGSGEKKRIWVSKLSLSSCTFAPIKEGESLLFLRHHSQEENGKKRNTDFSYHPAHIAAVRREKEGRGPPVLLAFPPQEHREGERKMGHAKDPASNPSAAGRDENEKRKKEKDSHSNLQEGEKRAPAKYDDTPLMLPRGSKEKGKERKKGGKGSFGG